MQQEWSGAIKGLNFFKCLIISLLILLYLLPLLLLFQPSYFFNSNPFFFTFSNIPQTCNVPLSIIYCCVTNVPKLKNLKQLPFIISHCFVLFGIGQADLIWGFLLLKVDGAYGLDSSGSFDSGKAQPHSLLIQPEVFSSPCYFSMCFLHVVSPCAISTLY